MDLTSGYPFWPVKHGLLRTYPRLATEITTDVAIIGGGITGALVAYHLAEAGIETVVVDKRDIGWGSTAATTALLQYEIDTSLADLTKLRGAVHANRAYIACLEAIDKIERIAMRLPGCGFERKKSLYLARKNRDRKALRTEWELRRAIGIDVEYLEPDEISERFLFERPAALLSADGAQLDAYAMTHALLGEAMRLGCRVFDRTNVEKIETAADVTLKTADGCRIRARYLVFASGYETQDYLKKKVAKLISTYAVVSEPLGAFPGWGEDQCLIWEHARPYAYMRTTDDGRVIMGGEDESFRSPLRRDRLIRKKAETLRKRFRELFQEIDFRIAFAWTGTFGETEDGLAYIGQHQDWPRSFFALGYGGNGITYSVLAAEIIRDALLGKPNQNADLFRFNR